MRRREFIKVFAGSAVWPLAARAQTSDKPAIGFLSARSAKESAHLVDAFRKGLAEHGLVDGQNVTVDYSWADSHYERLPAQASDLLARQPAVLISVGGDMTAKVAAAATHTTPIVAVFIGDPVVGGFVASLSRPGGNITGVSNLNAVIEAKRLGLLRDVKPGITSVGALLNPDSITAAESAKRYRGSSADDWPQRSVFGSQKRSGACRSFQIDCCEPYPCAVGARRCFFCSCPRQACRIGSAKWRPCDLFTAGIRRFWRSHELRK